MDRDAPLPYDCVDQEATVTDTTLPTIRCGARRCDGHALPSDPRPHPSGILYVEYRCNLCAWTAVDYIRPAPSILDTASPEFRRDRPAGRPPGRRDRTGERVDDGEGDGQLAMPGGRSGRLPS